MIPLGWARAGAGRSLAQTTIASCSLGAAQTRVHSDGGGIEGRWTHGPGCFLGCDGGGRKAKWSEEASRGQACGRTGPNGVDSCLTLGRSPDGAAGDGLLDAAQNVLLPQLDRTGDQQQKDELGGAKTHKGTFDSRTLLCYAKRWGSAVTILGDKRRSFREWLRPFDG